MIVKIKELVEKKTDLVFFVVLILQIVLVVILGCMKSNFHQDELFSLETAHYLADATPSNCYMHQTEIFSEKNWLNVSEFKSFLVVDENSSILGEDISSIVKKIIFSSPYECMINIFAGLLVPGLVSKWIGILINIFFIILSQILLYKLASGLRESKCIGLIVAFLYGFSGIFLGFSVYTRFYCFVLAMIMIAIFLHYKMWNEKSILRFFLYELISYFCLYEALLCSQLIAIIIIGLYASFFVGVIFRKKWKYLITYFVPVIIGLGYFLKDYLYFARNIIINPSEYIKEGEPLDLMLKGIEGLSIRSAVRRSFTYFSYLGDYLFGSIIVLFLLIIFIGYLFIRNRKNIKTCKKSNSFIFVIYGVVIVYSIFSIVVSLWLPRYYALIYPLIMVLVVCLFDLLIQKENIITKYIVCVVYLFGFVLTFLLGRIDNIFYEERDVIRRYEEIDTKVQHHVIWNMDDFQIIMECVYQADEDDLFYVCNENEKLDYTQLSDDFMLWVCKSDRLDDLEIVRLNDNGYCIEEDIGVIADAQIYYCKKYK